MHMPVDIVAAGALLKVQSVKYYQDMVLAPALRKRCQAYLDYYVSVHYIDCITKPQLELKLERNYILQQKGTNCIIKTSHLQP